MVSGCSGPWFRSRSASAAWNTEMASAGPPGRLVGRGEPVPGHHGVRVRGAEQPGAGGQHGLPVRDGGVGQPAVLQRQPGAEQQRMGLGLPQHPAVVGPQRRGAVPQRLIELRPALAFRPGLQQRVGGGQRDLLEVGLRQVGPHGGLDAGVHLHGAHRAGRIDGDQAHRGQVVDGGPHHVLVRPARRARPPGDIAAGGRAGQHGAGDPVVVHHGGQHERRPGQPGRRQLVRALGGQRPGGQHRGRRPVHRRTCACAARPAPPGTPGSPAGGR